MTDEAPPPPAPPGPPGPAKPPRRKRPPPAAPTSSGGQAFRLLKFEGPSDSPVVQPQPRVVAELEEWLTHARAGRLVALGVIAVTDEGAMVQKILHTQATIAGLLTANRMMETMIVQALLTTYQAPPGTILKKVDPANAPPPPDPEDGNPEKDEEE